MTLPIIRSVAFFISPKGQIIFVPKTHINYIITKREEFGLSEKFISELYKKYNEPIGLEGKAREEILKKIINTGWIRLRRYNDRWSITLDELTNQNKKYLQEFSEYILYTTNDLREENRQIPVSIRELKTMKNYHINELAIMATNNIEAVLKIL